jgi:hypothetical protein
MLRRTLQAFPRFDKNYDEVKYVGRRLMPLPQYHALVGVRLPEIACKFKDVGPDYDRVWVSLGGQMRRRRVGRSTDRKDFRYYWRPLPKGIQRLYTNPARRAMNRLGTDVVPRLHAKANEQGVAYSGRQLEHRGTKQLFGARHAALLPMDWEYRVF